MTELQRALETHQQAVQAFLASARALPPERWSQPRAEGKWSRLQIHTRHHHLQMAPGAA